MSYGVRARILPVVLTALPAACSVVALAPMSIDWRALASFPILGILAFFIDQLGRDLGRGKQEELWLKWGGSPTTLLLRHREDSNNPILLEKRHANLRSKTGVSLPTKDQEIANPENADAKYEAAISVMRTSTYDAKKYPLVFLENCNYGFRRNCYGLKRLAITVCGLAAMVNVTLGALTFAQVLNFSLGAIIGCFAVAICFLGFWMLVVTASWVKVAAMAYAERLIDSAGTTS